MKKCLLMLMLVVCAVGFTLAQRTISGRITDNKGEALIGANVLVKGTTTGTSSDVDGNFTLSVPSGRDMIQVSYAGYTTQEVALSASNVLGQSNDVLNITLLEDSKALQEVVVTAQGIARERKTLGYANTQIKSEEIAQKPETDVARAIAGRSPGINIASSSGLAGSGTKINIRGISTVSGDSQPLWIVDGVPINTASNENNNFRDGNVTPTRNLDIDPNNIASINILRGLSATTLYGSQGRNGVILVTTKTGASGKGKGQIEGSVSQSYNIVEAIVPEYQNNWLNGFDGAYGEFFSNWGPLFTNPAINSPKRHPYFEHRLLFPEHPEFAEATNYTPVAQPNNIKDFFKRGNSTTTSVNVGMNSAMTSFNVNFSHLDENGFIENNKLTRNNFSIGGVANLTDKLKLTGTFNYVQTNFQTPPVGAGTGSNSEGGPSVFANLFYLPRNIDLTNWPYQNPVTGASVYYRNGGDITNPRWLLYNSRQTSNTDRFFGTMSASYQIVKWFNLTYRLGLDTYTERQEYYTNKGAAGFPSTPYDLTPLAKGFLVNTTGVNNINDHSLLGAINFKIGEDLEFTSNLGLNGRTDNYTQQGLYSNDQVVFGLITPTNFINKSDRDIRQINGLNYIEKRTILGAFADITLGFKNMLYVNVSGRNDWASTHEKANRSLFYPGVSVSFLPTTAFPGLKAPWLDLLKLRAGYGTSANFATPYNTRAYLSLNSALTVDGIGNVIGLGLPTLLANPGLKPELLREAEFGLEAQTYNGRLGLDLSLYDRRAKDQIIERQLDPSTGYNSTFINAGEISNKGIELGLNIVPIRTKNFEWNLRANFTRNRSKVESLPEGSKEILISGFTNLGSFAVEGQPYGVIKGTRVERTANGELLINSNGDWAVSRETHIIADPNPKYLLTGITSFTFFNAITIGAHLDYVHGGQIFSYTASTMVGRGVAKELESFNPELPLILPGVSEVDGKPNTIPMPPSNMFFANTILGGGANDRGIFDATRLRLREVSLLFNLPKKFLGSRNFIKGATVSIIANNMWFRAFNTPKYAKVDADRTAFGTGNGAGFDFLSGPSAKRYGATLKVNF